MGINNRTLKRSLFVGAVFIACIIFYQTWARQGKSYVSPSGFFELRYPKSWSYSMVDGAITFYNQESLGSYRENVTLVVAKMAPDWRENFANSLAQGFQAIGGNFTLETSKQTTRNGRSVDSFVYRFSSDENEIANTAYVFDAGGGLAVVMTCSARSDDASAAASSFAMFYESLTLK
jgi:hypothetical protein